MDYSTLKYKLKLNKLILFWYSSLKDLGIKGLTNAVGLLSTEIVFEFKSSFRRKYENDSQTGKAVKCKVLFLSK